MIRQQSLQIPNTARGASVAVSGSSAQSGVMTTADAVLTATVDCFVICGANPAATTSCAFLPANVPMPCHGWSVGDKLAFITSGATGTVYITPRG